MVAVKKKPREGAPFVKHGKQMCDYAAANDFIASSRVS